MDKWKPTSQSEVLHEVLKTKMNKDIIGAKRGFMY